MGLHFGTATTADAFSFQGVKAITEGGRPEETSGSSFFFSACKHERTLRADLVLRNWFTHFSRQSDGSSRDYTESASVGNFLSNRRTQVASAFSVVKSDVGEALRNSVEVLRPLGVRLQTSTEEDYKRATFLKPGGICKLSDWC